MDVRERLSSAPTSSNTLKHLIPNACIARNIVFYGCTFFSENSINPEDKVSLKYILRQFLKCQKIFLTPSENKTKGLELHRDWSEIKCSENSSSEKSCWLQLH